MPVLADDDVVVHGDAERAGERDDLLGHLDVGARWRRVAGGMIVDDAIHFIYRVENYEIFVRPGSVWELQLGAVFDAPA